jgi:hypothetical protein
VGLKKTATSQIHRLMLKDVSRTEAYQKAILGNKEQFEGKIVMDIGAGTGKTNEQIYPYEKSNQGPQSNQKLFFSSFSYIIIL